MSKTLEMELYTGLEIEKKIRERYDSDYALLHKEDEVVLISVEEIGDRLFDGEAFYIEEYRGSSWSVYEHSTHNKSAVVVSSTSILEQFKELRSSIESIEDRLDDIERVLGEMSGVTLKE